MNMNFDRTEQARAKQKQRRALHAAQRSDPLKKRAELVAYWKDRDQDLHPSARIRPRFPVAHPIYKNRVFWRYLMPKLAAHMTARDQEFDRQWRADMKASADRMRAAKAAKAALQAPQQSLFS